MKNTVNYNGKTYNWETVSSYFDLEISESIDAATNEEFLETYIERDAEFADLFAYDFTPID